jgi:hypothetical protein
MATKSTDFNRDFAFGEVAFVKPASEEDMKQGIDAWLGGISFAWRRRRISVLKYGEISVRHSRVSGTKTERDKLLDGSFKAVVYFFQFTDAVIVCRVSDVVGILQRQQYTVQGNPDGATTGCYIKLTDIPHLKIDA